MSVIDYLTTSKYIENNLSKDKEVVNVADEATINFVTSVLTKNNYNKTVLSAYDKIMHAIMASKLKRVSGSTYNGEIDFNGVKTIVRIEHDYNKVKSNFINLVLAENNLEKQYNLRITYNDKGEALIDERKMKIDFSKDYPEVSGLVQNVCNIAQKKDGTYAVNMERKHEIMSDNGEDASEVVVVKYPSANLIVSSWESGYVNYFKVIPNSKKEQTAAGISLVENDTYMYSLNNKSGTVNERVDLNDFKRDFGVAVKDSKLYEIEDEDMKKLHDQVSSKIEVGIMGAYGTAAYENLGLKMPANTIKPKKEDIVQ